MISSGADNCNKAMKSNLMNPVLSLMICIQLKHIFLKNICHHLGISVSGIFQQVALCAATINIQYTVPTWIFSGFSLQPLVLYMLLSAKGSYAVTVHSLLRKFTIRTV